MDRSTSTEVEEDEMASGGLRARVREYERGLLLSALAATGGNQRRAAAMLGLLPTTLHEKLKRHGLLARPRPGETATGDDDQD